MGAVIKSGSLSNYNHIRKKLRHYVYYSVSFRGCSELCSIRIISSNQDIRASIIV